MPRIFAVTSDDRLVAFKPGTPGTIDSTHTITNLQAGETIRAIDFRPSTGEIVGLGSSSRLYTIDKNTGAATAIGVGAFTPVLTGTEFGMDFGPTFDTLRVVSDTGQNLRLDPNAGTIGFADTALVYAAGDPNFSTPPTVVALANSNNFSGTTSSLAYGIDSGLDVLVTLGSAVVPPGNGKLFTIGALGVDASTLAGFDISSDGAAYAALTGPGGVSSQLYTIDLSTGAATLVATIGVTATIRDIAVEPPADPLIYGVTTDNHLVSFLIGRPGTLSSNSAISGLQPSENVLTIDFRPSTGDLVAVGSSSRLYRVSRSSGAATVIGSGPFTPVLSGVEFGADFNPFADALRVVSDAGQNLRLNPNTGAVAATDTMLEFASGDPNFGFPPIVVGIAYNSNVPGATATALYGMDSSIDILVTIGTTGESPNLGHVFSMGGLGIDTTDVAGLDIATNGAAFALINPSVGGSSELRTINLVTGAATLIGSIAGTALRDIAVPPTGL